MSDRIVAPRQTVAAKGDELARSLRPIIAEIRAGGLTSLRAIAAELNDRGIETRRGRRWHVSNVRNLIARLNRTTR